MNPKNSKHQNTKKKKKREREKGKIRSLSQSKRKVAREREKSVPQKGNVGSPTKPRTGSKKSCRERLGKKILSND